MSRTAVALWLGICSIIVFSALVALVSKANQTAYAKEDSAADLKLKQDIAKIYEVDPNDKIFLASKAGKVWLKHKDWSKSVCRIVAEHKVTIGMTEDQAVAAWGRPQRINRSIRSSGTDDQWVYHDSQYLFFDDGILTSISTSK